MNALSERNRRRYTTDLSAPAEVSSAAPVDAAPKPVVDDSDDWSSGRRNI